MDKPKSNKVKIIIIIIAVLIVLAILAIVLAICLRKKSNNGHLNFFSTDKRILNYYPENHNLKFYSIIENSNYFKILEKYQVMCFKSPCNPITKDTKEIKDKEAIKNLTSLFDEVFNSTNGKEITIKEKELTDQQKEIINNIFKNNEIFITKFKYEILNNTVDFNSKYSKRGYYIENINDNVSVIVTIAMGMKNSGGYSIKIKNIDIINDDELVQIFVEESSPGADQMVPDVITYPYAKVKFNQKPKNLFIINDETLEEFKEVNI